MSNLIRIKDIDDVFSAFTRGIPMRRASPNKDTQETNTIVRKVKNKEKNISKSLIYDLNTF